MATTDLLRAVLLASATAGLGACASNPPGPPAPSGPAPIDFRGAAPVGRPQAVRMGEVMVPASPAASPAPVQQAVAPPADVVVQRVVDMGVSPTGASAIEEAKAMRAEAGARPGGTLRQVRDNPSKRAIEVQARDTLYDISRRYSVNMRALIETNALEPPYALSAGDIVYLPPPNVHVVERGETLYSVSRRYNVDTRSLAILNNMQRPWTVYPGDELQLPPLAREQQREAVRPLAPAPAIVAATSPAVAPPVKAPMKAPARPGDDDKAISLTAGPAAGLAAGEPKLAARAGAASSGSPAGQAALAPTAPAPAAPPKYTPPPSGANDFIWPVSGQVLKAFGSGADGQRNDGVNIAAPRGAQVRAAAGGEVVYAGNELAGFGNLVLIRHPGGWVTAYAHSDALLVKEGDLVKQGQPIASAGATGNAPTTQVHFELRKGKEPVDPAQHLPALKG